MSPGDFSMKTEVICTLGPASMARSVIQRLVDEGVSLLRLNLSHTPLEKLDEQIAEVRSATQTALCLDTEGAQIRTGSLSEGSIELRSGGRTRIAASPCPGDVEQFNLYPLDVWRKLELGDIISLDFNAALVQVVAKDDSGLELHVLSGGKVGRNKAVSVDREIELPGLTEKDLAAIAIGRKLGIRDYALSFAANAAEVHRMRSLVGAGCRIIAKIESTHGLRNQREIISEADAILIDRGDLSREIPIEAIPAAQKQIIGNALELQTPAFVATNLLETMIEGPNPTRAEVNDIYNTLVDGASGLVLAAETAIGIEPVKSLRMLRRVIRQFEEGRPVTASAPRAGDLPGISVAAYELRPAQARAVFDTKGWGRVTAFLSSGLGANAELSDVRRALLETRADGLVVERSLLPASPVQELADRMLFTSWPAAWREAEAPGQWTVMQWRAFLVHLKAMGCTHCYVQGQVEAELSPERVGSRDLGIELLVREAQPVGAGLHCLPSLDSEPSILQYRAVP